MSPHQFFSLIAIAAIFSEDSYHHHNLIYSDSDQEDCNKYDCSNNFHLNQTSCHNYWDIFVCIIRIL